MPPTGTGKARARARDAPIDPRIPKGANVKRSIYYDPVWNPYGAPPPGMPYKERCTCAPDTAPTPDPYAVNEAPSKTALSAKDTAPAAEDSDDDIALPTAPRPPSDDDSDDDIVMPAGPPPPEARVAPPMPIVQPRIAAPRAQPETVAPVRYEAPPLTRKQSDAEPADSEGDAPPSDLAGGETTLSAAPQLRAFQHDATAFVPTSVRKRARQR
ncbi:hypothetical protein MBRA1_001479 [Malassezia brasiliensis]|uniref:Uncharacterized protein n=1 Tax=Malassezia brasiliensis TaxID=1821822 RepID=A0AAF0DSZ1_9BASI|nr:hypothetical protein MBRA1_001479 [Malassezia brasiliensis]